MKNVLTSGFLALFAAQPAYALSPEELFAKLSPSIYVIHTWNEQGRRLALGSGVVVGAEKVVTNCHVLRKASSVAVSRGNVSYGAELEFPDAERDLCQLKVRELTAPAVAFGEAGALKVGQRVYAIGAPRGLELSLSEGLVSSLRGGRDDRLPLIQTTAAISEGSSGGGLFDASGRLVGITTLGFQGEQLNFALPIDWVREVEQRGKDALARRKQIEEARLAAARAGAGGAAAVGLGPVDPTLPKEMPQAGDTWTYVARDLMFNPADQSRKFTHTVRNATRGAIVEIVTAKGVQVGESAFSADFHGVYRAGPQLVEVAPFATAFHKLRPGERFGGIKILGMEAMAASTFGEEPYSFDGARVVGQERVTVPAGTFDALRVDFSGRVSNILTGGSAVMRGHSSFRQTAWYAPAVKRIVKLVAEGPSFFNSYELESYALR